MAISRRDVGYFWGDRFKSVIVDKGETLVNCLAYIDLNPLRAGIAKYPEEYRWKSIGYHIRANNKDKFLSTDFGLQEFNVKNEKERVRRYRKYMYHAGSIDRPDKGKAKVIDRVYFTEKREKISRSPKPAACAIAPAPSRIRVSSGQKSLLSNIISSSSIFFSRKMRKSQYLSKDCLGFIQ